MDKISSSSWMRKGSSIVFDQKSLGGFIASGDIVSLQDALGWFDQTPSSPPVKGKTILIIGLDTTIETFEPSDADEFLINRIRPLIIKLQNLWTDYGVVFGFASHAKAFEETAIEEEVIFRRRDQKTVRLSDGLWDGTAAVNMRKIVREDEEQKKEVVVGYYVARIS